MLATTQLPLLPAPRAVAPLLLPALLATLDVDCHAVASLLVPLTRARPVAVPAPPLALPVPALPPICCPTTVTDTAPVLHTLDRTTLDTSAASLLAARVAVPTPTLADTATASPRVPPLLLLGLLRMLVDDSHAVPLTLLCPSRDRPDTSCAPIPAPTTVTDTAPVAAKLAASPPCGASVSTAAVAPPCCRATLTAIATVPAICPIFARTAVALVHVDASLPVRCACTRPV